MDAETYKPSADLLGHIAEVDGVAWAPDSRRVVTGGRDHTAGVWTLPVAKQPVRATWGGTVTLAWRPDSQTIGVVSDTGSVKLLQLSSGKIVLESKRTNSGLRG